MDQLNLRHLHYFWVISREGSITRASEVLDLAPQTLSGQLTTFEQAVGGKLFSRQNRRLNLTELGLVVQRYADDIFALTGELSEMLRLAPTERPLSLSAGISASIHKLIAYQLLQPAMKLEREVYFDCRTGRPEDLLLSLKRRELDVIFTDRMPATEPSDGLVVHPLSSSTISLFAAPKLAQNLRSGFPLSLNRQPLLANATDAPYFRKLMNWFTLHNVRMNLVARVDDSALIKVFGREGLGVFAAPTAIQDEVCRQYQVDVIASLDDVTDQLYAVTRSRNLTHEAVRVICETARNGGSFSV